MLPPIALPTDEPLGILLTTREEMAALARNLGLPEALGAGARTVRGCVGATEVALARSGIGADRARAATEALIEDAGCHGVIIAGFASSLRDGVSAGDIVLATAVLDGPRAIRKQQAARAARASGQPQPAFSDDGRLLPSMDLLTVVRQVMLDSTWGHMGSLVTWPTPLYTADQKVDLSATVPGVVAADIQAAGAAAVCIEAGVRWAAVCAITDGIDDDLPLEFMRYVDPTTGELDRGRVARAATLRPWKAPGLLTFRSRSARGSEQLAAFLASVVRDINASSEADLD